MCASLDKYVLNDVVSLSQRLKKYHCLEAINKSLGTQGYSIAQVGIAEVRHFLYKSRSTAQFTAPRLEAPYMSTEDWNHLFGLYQYLHHRMYKSSRPLKMLYYSGERETMVGWVSMTFYLLSLVAKNVYFSFW